MLGKLIGKTIGEVAALPFTLITEGEKAVSEAAKTVEKRVGQATEPSSRS